MSCKNKKTKKNSKSVEKRPSSSRKINSLFEKNVLIYRPKEDQQTQIKKSIAKIIDRSKTKSCLAQNNKFSRQGFTRLGLSCLADQQSQHQKGHKNNYFIETVIGKGGFGKVYRVKDKRNGQLLALKQMSKAMILAKRSSESVRNERQLLQQVRYPLIVPMKAAFQDRQHLYLLMQLMQGGDLRYHISRKYIFSQDQARFFSACLVLSLQYLHSHKIIHRDIKPQNLVFDSKGYLHLTDLGIAKRYRVENASDNSGTPGYMAPQVMTKQNHSYEVDYYAMGVILYELMMKKRPYVGKDRKTIRQQILSKQVLIKKQQIPEGWSIEAADFINKLLQRRPTARLGWNGSEQVKQHVWLRNYPWQKLQKKLFLSPFREQSYYDSEIVRYPPTKQDQELQESVKQNKILLRNAPVQQLFQGYTYVDDLRKQDRLTTSSQLYRRQAI